MSAIFTPLGDDRFAVRLPEEIRSFLGSLAASAVPTVTERWPAAWRLFPPAFADDPEREAAYQELVGQELVDARVDNLELLVRTSGEETIDAEDLDGWMHALETLRLILGANRGGPEAADADDLERHAVTMDVLSQLQHAAIVALAPELDEVDP